MFCTFIYNVLRIHQMIQFLKAGYRLIILSVFALLFTQCTSVAKLFQQGEAILNNEIETIPIAYPFKLPISEVEIQGKKYNFLIDTGAPTVISLEIYNDLKLKKKANINISDSQNHKHKQIITIIPEMKMGNAVFKDIAATALDWSDNPALSCLNIHGIIGANQMSKAIWKFNYKEEIVEIVQQLSDFDTTGFNYVIPFVHYAQMTPLVKMNIEEETYSMIFDTGSNRKITINNPEIRENIPLENQIEIYGGTSLGIYGKPQITTNYTFQVPKIKFNNLTISNTIVSTSASATIGNSTLEFYEFILDWGTKNIFLKKINNQEEDLSGFGFGYYFNNGQAIVSYIYKDHEIPLEVGDIIININDRDYVYMDDNTICEYQLNKLEDKFEEIDIKVQRDSEILEFKLEKKRFFAPPE